MRDRFTNLRLLCAAAVSFAAWHATAQESNPVRTAPPAADTGRLIVTFRDAVMGTLDKGVAQTQSVDASTQSIDDRVTAMAARVGLRVRQARALGAGMQVLDVEPAYPGEPAAERLARVRADSAVASAELDGRRYIHAVPNDPLYTGQWYWQSSTVGGNASATDAESAWDLTTGNDGVVIAVIDTGILFDHPDLKRIADAGRVLPGYDFVRDVDVANDGNGIDADATDPGDWITQADKSKSVFSDCDVANSSWHGTRVAGIICARTNSASPDGIAGGTWKPWILPVRALG
jgi:serine protease